MRHVGEGAVAIIVKQLCGSILISDEQIETAVVVKIQPDRRLRRRYGHGELCFTGYVGEGPVAIVPQQGFSDWKGPPAPHHVDIQPAVVVVVRLDEIEASKLVRQPGLDGSIRESSIPVIVQITQ